MKVKLTQDNFIQLAMKYYDNVQCTSLEEFNLDLQRFMHLTKLFNRYQENKELRERLIMNHIIVLYNLFGEIATDMLFFKIDKSHWRSMVTFMVYLNRLPEDSVYYGVDISQLKLDSNIIDRLRSL